MGVTEDDTARARLERLGLGEDDLAAWRDSGRGPEELDAWATDRVARRPAGRRARAVYGAEDVHDFARRALLAAVALRDGERLLDVGCGGGLLLRDAAAAGAVAVGVDHSPEMVALARERAPEAEVVEGRADALPCPDRSFDAVTMSMVLLFLDDPVAALREARRVLVPGGRLAAYTPGPELRGTPAAPEPIAGEARFHADEALAGFAREAGLAGAAVARDGGAQLLTARRPATPDVRLREVRPDDLDAHFTQQLDPESVAMAAVPARSREDFDAHWARNLTHPVNLVRSVVVDGEVVGSAVAFVVEDGRWMIGYWIARDHWGRGIAGAALGRLLEEVVHERPVFATVAAHNAASRRVLARAGFVETGETQDDDVRVVELRLD